MLAKLLFTGFLFALFPISEAIAQSDYVANISNVGVGEEGLSYQYNIGMEGQVQYGTGFSTVGGITYSGYGSGGTVTATDSTGNSPQEMVSTYEGAAGGYSSTSQSSANLYTGTLNVANNTAGGGYAKSYAVATDTLTFNIAGASADTVTDIPVTYNISGTSLDTGGSGLITLNVGSAAFMQGIGAEGAIGSPSVSGWVSYNFASDNDNSIIFNGVYAVTGPTAIVSVTETIDDGLSGGLDNYTTNLAIPPTPGVSYTSASGVFDTVVPEPATASLLIGCAAAATLRRRKWARSAG